MSQTADTAHDEQPPRRRVLPELNELNRAYWTGGASGTVQIMRCTACSRYIHPPAPICPACLTKFPVPTAVSGTGKVISFTVNHQAWYPDLAVPFVLAIIELDEQPGLRVTANIVRCAPKSVRIGLPVSVLFEQHEDVWLPLFEPLLP
ncbi:OB-fold domain-containing protein [Burkholderia sp. R-69980]|nr:OB-fold domain-containing protein [Burkholderia sp. R-69980]